MKKNISFDKILLFGYFITLSFLGAIFLALPISSTEKPIHFVDALFVSVSACCVTGLSTISMETLSTFGFIVIMVLIELGGLGLISFFMLYIGSHRKRISFSNRQFIRSFFVDEVDIKPKRIIFKIVTITFSVQIVGAICLFFIFSSSGISSRPLFDAIFHSISAFCNAGFSTYNNSLVSFNQNIPLMLVIIFLIVFGGIGFVVLDDVLMFFKTKSKDKMSYHSKVVIFTTTSLIILGTLFYFFANRDGIFKDMTFFEKIVNSLFQSVTTRTAGFETVTQKALTPDSDLITLILMFVGGSPGSMAGGIKTTTLFIIVSYAFHERNGSSHMTVFRRKLNSETIGRAFNIAFKAMAFILMSLLLLSMSEAKSLRTEVFSLFDLMFEVISAQGTVGLSMGITSQLSAVGKIILSFTMFIGRTGIYAMLLHIPSGKKIENVVEYPTEDVMLG